MAYDSGAENVALLKRTVTGTFDFNGRSRRTEVVYYWFATALLSTVIAFAIDTVLPWRADLILKLVLQIFLTLPLFALFTRRLHDQDRSGWWGFILPIVFLWNITQSIWFIISDPTGLRTTPDRATSYMLWIVGPLVLMYLVLTFMPGSAGANRFGSDPREG